MISWLTAAFTYNKIPKAHYHAFQMLTGLEDTLVGSGDGWFLTRGRERLVLVLYNYSHYSRLLSAGELFDMTPTERYTSFAGLTQKKFVLRVTDLPGPAYTLKHTYINRLHGSSYDCWVEMGGTDDLTGEEISYLCCASRPGRQRGTLPTENGTPEIKCVLEPLEVRLIEIEPARGKDESRK